MGISQQDSVRNKIVSEYFFQEDISQELKLVPVDSVIHKFYKFDEDGINGVVSVGNPGGAKMSLFQKPNNFGFNYGESVFDVQFKNDSKSKIYNTNIPFARIAYLSGPKKYQNFNLLFSENVRSTMNFAVKLKTYGSNGFYLNQHANNKLFSIQNSYKSRKNKYGYFLKFSVQSGSINENGGIKGDSIYLNNLRNDKLNVQVWFDELSTNRYDKRNLNVLQFYRFGQADSNRNKYDGIFLLLENSGGVDDFWYENINPDSVYFDAFNINVNDSTSIRDKSHLYYSNNTMMLKYRSFGGQIDLRFGYGLDVFKAETFVSDSTLITQKLKGHLKDFNIGNFVFNGMFEKGIAGYNSDGHQFNISSYGLFFDNRFKLGAKFLSIKTLPDYKMMRYAGSNIAWDNKFGYIVNNTLEMYVVSDSIGLSLSGKLTQTKNYTYFGRDAYPVQYVNSFGGYELRLQKNFTLKSYHFDVSIFYQGVDASAPKNIPSWIWNVSFYYQRYLFKGALELRYGIDYWQNSSYTADYYVPFTRSFIYQNEYTVGNYPYMDFYISARIRGAQGFVKFQNLGQLVLEQSYMMVPYYPMQDFGMSFGLRWDFFN